MNLEDNFANYGFLSKEINEISSNLNSENHKELVSSILEKINISFKLRDNYIKYFDNIEKYKGFLFWLRSIECCQAAVILTRIGLPGPAWSTLRTAWECTFTAAAIWRRPELTEQILKQNQFELSRLAKQLQNRSPHLMNDEVRPLLSAAIDANGENTGGWNMTAAAGVAGLTQEYDLYWRGASIAGAHATEFSITRLIKTRPDGSEYVNALPDFEDVEKILGGVLSCLEIGIARFQELWRLNFTPA